MLLGDSFRGVWVCLGTPVERVCLVDEKLLSGLIEEFYFVMVFVTFACSFMLLNYYYNYT